MKSSVSVKGQVIIPKPLRDRLGIRAGTVLEFDEKDGKLVARKADAVDPIAAVFGILPAKRSTDDVMVELRGKPEKV